MVNIFLHGKFIPVFEKNNFIIKLDENVFEKVCKDIKVLKNKIKNMPIISVNISKETLIENNFLEKYLRILSKYKINASEIELEITEGIAINNELDIKEILTKIKNKGFKISIDDFGTGYSSLNMLQIMPIDIIKIDKSFIDKIDKFNNNENLIEVIMMIAKKMNLKTVAEGVEDKEQVDYLKKVKCDLIQGYYYSKPIKLEKFIEYINMMNEKDNI
ncbi:MAG: EAL domain-containing protein [Clostridia bacterium]|nr:EAL domain-containing protein [Clostridium sp.]